MPDIRPVTATFAVAPQIQADEVVEIAAKGFKMIVCNRPDGEAPDQPSAAQIQAAAAAAGMTFADIPIRGGATPAQVDAMRAALAAAPGPVLAYCRSGTRSVTAWALGAADDLGAAAVVKAAAEAGYDLSPLFG